MGEYGRVDGVRSVSAVHSEECYIREPIYTRARPCDALRCQALRPISQSFREPCLCHKDATEYARDLDDYIISASVTGCGADRKSVV